MLFVDYREIASIFYLCWLAISGEQATKCCLKAGGSKTKIRENKTHIAAKIGYSVFWLRQTVLKGFGGNRNPPTLLRNSP